MKQLDSQTIKALDVLTKIGILKQLHKDKLISDSEFSALVTACQQKPYHEKGNNS